MEGTYGLIHFVHKDSILYLSLQRILYLILRLPRTCGSHNDGVCWVWWLPYRDCHGFFKASQWRAHNHNDGVEVLSLRAKRSNPQTTNSKYKNRKEKEIIIIYQVKELISNEILIFNFQFSISYASFVSHFVGQQAKMIMQAYHFPTLCFNFQFLSQPPCCFATSPLTKGGKPHKSLIINTKTEKKKNSINQ